MTLCCFYTGNNWHVEGVGKGDQEEFYGCANIAILGTGSPNTPNPPVSTMAPPTVMPTSYTTKLTTVWTPEPRPVPNDLCEGKDDRKYDQWCNYNCNHTPAYMPDDKCKPIITAGSGW